MKLIGKFINYRQRVHLINFEEKSDVFINKRVSTLVIS